MAAQKKKHGARAPGQVVKLQSVLGQVLQTRRRELGMDQAEFATKLGVSPATASKIETGRQDVSFDQLWRVAHALDWSPVDLVGRVQEAVRVLLRNKVKVLVSRAAQVSSSGDEVTAAALGGLLGFLLGRSE